MPSLMRMVLSVFPRVKWNPLELRDKFPSYARCIEFLRFLGDGDQLRCGTNRKYPLTGSMCGLMFMRNSRANGHHPPPFRAKNGQQNHPEGITATQERGDVENAGFYGSRDEKSAPHGEHALLPGYTTPIRKSGKIRIEWYIQ